MEPITLGLGIAALGGLVASFLLGVRVPESSPLKEASVLAPAAIPLIAVLLGATSLIVFPPRSPPQATPAAQVSSVHSLR
jgi:hypothetical protein